MKKALFVISIIAISFVAGWYINQYLVNRQSEETSSVVLLEKMKEVCKLVTVEGSFSELYTHEDYNYYDFYPFRKKALLKINAQVTAGYNLEEVTFNVDEVGKVVYISNMPDPEIMSVDTKISYYDLSEGTFNTFSGKDLTELNRNARNFMVVKAKSSSLLDQAKKEGEKTMHLVTLFLEQAGYKVQLSKGTGSLD